ncbi:MAG: hypothetical protein HYW51_00670 [Candidatus Doudnabacteria bacterium]|nr:hypothetical protein [Candidatus Doudnabacteria bacterium]
MDILHIQKLNKIFLKATHDKLPISYKLGVLVLLISLLGLSAPHQTIALDSEAELQAIVFVQGDQYEYLNLLKELAEKNYRIDKLKNELNKQRTLAGAVRVYLEAYRSPLAGHVETLIKARNWKKIVALANAESSLCRNYPETTANCWGVGGSDLWVMGSNLDEGILAMDEFLITSPKKSEIKYTDMSFEQMNGLYKQPARDHWVENTLMIYNDLEAIENNLAGNSI